MSSFGVTVKVSPAATNGHTYLALRISQRMHVGGPVPHRKCLRDDIPCSLPPLNPEYHRIICQPCPHYSTPFPSLLDLARLCGVTRNPSPPCHPYLQHLRRPLQQEAFCYACPQYTLLNWRVSNPRKAATRGLILGGKFWRQTFRSSG